MLDLLKKNLMIGAGLASMTRTKLKEMGKKLAEESKLSEAEGEKFINDLLKQAEDTKKSFEKQVSSAVEKAMEKLRPPCICRLEKIEKELKSLKKEMKKPEKK
jgi:polyhydroxyalkanoate synthesis regulator phasin